MDDLTVLTRKDLRALGIPCSRPYSLRLEREGRFPKRHYITPTCPVWSRVEVEAWLRARADRAEARAA